jgi:hypothetical protein
MSGIKIFNQHTYKLEDRLLSLCTFVESAYETSDLAVYLFDTCEQILADWSWRYPIDRGAFIQKFSQKIVAFHLSICIVRGTGFTCCISRAAMLSPISWNLRYKTELELAISSEHHAELILLLASIAWRLWALAIPTALRRILSFKVEYRAGRLAGAAFSKSRWARPDGGGRRLWLHIGCRLDTTSTHCPAFTSPTLCVHLHGLQHRHCARGATRTSLQPLSWR